MPETPEEIRDQFVSRKAQYEAYCACVQRLTTTILTQHDIPVHSIEFRVKDADSLYKKLRRPGKHYESLVDVTDLAGLRIITYLPEDVDKVAGLIEAEFAIDKVNSVDKRQANDPDRFGYASLHNICSLTDQRLSLTEYAGFRGLKCEIQVRTILQHAWAEIEHDLGYKSAIAVPAHIRRRFSRMAALLETADEEFTRLKNDIALYSKNVQDKVKNASPGVALDRITLGVFVGTSELLRSIEKRAQLGFLWVILRRRCSFRPCFLGP